MKTQQEIEQEIERLRGKLNSHICSKMPDICTIEIMIIGIIEGLEWVLRGTKEDATTTQGSK